MNSKTLDRIAITSSILCAFHCAVLPIIITTSAWVGLNSLRNPYIEWGFIFLGLLLFYVSIWRSMKKHRSKSVMAFALVGVFVLILSRFSFVEHLEVYLTCAGSLSLVCAHLNNIKCTNSLQLSRNK